MKLRGWPRSIRFQLLAGLTLVELLSLILFGTLLMRQQSREIDDRAEQRLAHQSISLSAQATEGLRTGRPEMEAMSVKMMGAAPSVAIARITDTAGKVLYVNEGRPEDHPLKPAELAQIPLVQGEKPSVFDLGKGDWEGLKPIVNDAGKLVAYAWVETDRKWDRDQLGALMRSLSLFAAIWIAASVALVWVLAWSITQPLKVLHRGTRALMQSPENHANFPLPVTVHNEIGDLIEAFNRMVASIEEQRSGLSDTLSLLDSMLANAPIGLAFFDRRCRFVRVNRIFAETTGVALSRHLGRTLPEVLPPEVALTLEEAIVKAFERDAPISDVELTGLRTGAGRPWTWIASAYPIHTAADHVRWVGLIVMDASDRKRSEEALRKTEKLAATGRLAASIAHEINNPLEAITNLLYLVGMDQDLDAQTRNLVEMTEHEVRRISEITQQTLRFYRQSTLPTNARLSELLDSVLSLHVGRLRTLGIEVQKKYDPNIELHCFAGELRQVFANLVGNAIDAMTHGGRLVVRARRSRDWSNPHREGVRFQVADTGSGMSPEVREHIFEAFFTTKDVTGTGLGLWVSSEIIAKHHGLVRVRSRAAALAERAGGGSGTVFELFFPDQVTVPDLPHVKTRATINEMIEKAF